MNLQFLSLISTCLGTGSQSGLGSLRQSYSTCLENSIDKDNLESLGYSKQYKSVVRALLKADTVSRLKMTIVIVRLSTSVKAAMFTLNMNQLAVRSKLDFKSKSQIKSVGLKVLFARVISKC